MKLMGGNIRKLFSILAALFVLFFLTQTNAQGTTQNNGITISPLTFNFEIKPGANQTGKIEVTNQDNTDLNYTMDVQLFDKTDENGAPSFKAVQPVEGIDSLINWVTFDSSKSGTIAPHKSATVNFTITVPISAEPGGHYGAIFAKQIKGSPTGGNQLGVVMQVGALTLVTVPGTAVKTISLSDFSIPKIIWYGPLDLSFKVINTGTIHFDSKGTITVEPLFGSKQELDAGTHTILPNSIRVYKAVLDNHFPFGKYKFTAKAVDGDGKEASIVVNAIAIPLIPILSVIGGLIIFFALFIYIKRHFKLSKV